MRHFMLINRRRIESSNKYISDLRVVAVAINKEVSLDNNLD